MKISKDFIFYLVCFLLVGVVVPPYVIEIATAFSNPRATAKQSAKNFIRETNQDLNISSSIVRYGSCSTTEPGLDWRAVCFILLEFPGKIEKDGSVRRDVLNVSCEASLMAKVTGDGSCYITSRRRAMAQDE